MKLSEGKVFRNTLKHLKNEPFDVFSLCFCGLLLEFGEQKRGFVRGGTFISTGTIL